MTNYIEMIKKSELSCEGCAFLKQIFKKKQVKDPKNPKKKIIVDEPTGDFGCYAPKGEPYASCMERGVIFTQGRDL